MKIFVLPAGTTVKLLKDGVVVDDNFVTVREESGMMELLAFDPIRFSNNGHKSDSTEPMIQSVEHRFAPHGYSGIEKRGNKSDSSYMIVFPYSSMQIL